MVTAEIYPMLEMCYSYETSILRENMLLPVTKEIPSLALPRNSIILIHHLIQCPLYFCQVAMVAYGRLKTKTFQTFTSKSGRNRLREGVAYKRFKI